MRKRRATTILLVVGALLLMTVAGVALAKIVQCKPDKKCEGTKKDDLLIGTSGPDRIFGLKGDDDMLGLGDSDRLVGSKGSDRLEGGAGDQADDELDGGEGEDGYTFEGNWGDDVIIDTANVDNQPSTGNEVLIRNVVGNLIVNLNSDAGPAHEVTDGINTINWSCPTNKDPACNPNVIGGARVRTPGNDTLTGNSVANFFDNSENPAEGPGGTDIISGAEGDDVIENSDKSGADNLSGGEGDDAFFNGDESGIDTVSGGEGNDEIESLESDADEDGDIDPGGSDTVHGEGGDDTINVQDGLGGDTVDCGENADASEDNDTVIFDPPDPVAGDPGDVINANCETQNP